MRIFFLIHQNFLYKLHQIHIEKIQNIKKFIFIYSNFFFTVPHKLQPHILHIPVFLIQHSYHKTHTLHFLVVENRWLHLLLSNHLPVTMLWIRNNVLPTCAQEVSTTTIKIANIDILSRFILRFPSMQRFIAIFAHSFANK